MRPERERERGAALLTVLLLVAVVAVIAGTALEKLRLATRIAGNAEATQAAQGYVRAAETMATTRIDGLLGPRRDRVTLAGGWSGRPFPLPLPGGVALARVTDGGNCFNLNGLVAEAQPGQYIASPAQRVVFARLMRLVGVPGYEAETISAAATDWIDSDQEPQPNGAEDGAYLSLTTPYRTAGTLMADPSELRAVNGVTPEIYAKLRRWICTLPVAQPSRINVNTLNPEDAPLFAMLLPDTLSVGAAQAMIGRRPPAGFASTDEFWKLPALASITASPEATGQTATTTTWFALTVDVTLGPARLESRSLVDASRAPAQIASRQWGEAT